MFPSPRKAGAPISEVKSAWSRIKAAAGIPADVRVHDLRRTAASYHAMGGISLPVIGKLLNHAIPRPRKYMPGSISTRCAPPSNNCTTGWTSGKQQQEDLSTLVRKMYRMTYGGEACQYHESGISRTSRKVYTEKGITIYTTIQPLGRRPPAPEQEYCDFKPLQKSSV